MLKETDFFNNLTNLDHIGNRKGLYLLGDLNGRMGKQDAGKVVRRYGEDVVNDNGECMINVCDQNNLKIWNGFPAQRYPQICIYPTNQKLKIYHIYTIGKANNKIVEDCRVYRGAECGSDHFLIRCRLLFPLRKTIAHIRRELRNKNEQNRVYRGYKLDLLQDPCFISVQAKVEHKTQKNL